MEDYFKQITIEINSYDLEQLFYLRVDLRIKELEIYYLSHEDRKQKELYLLGEEDISKLKQLMSKEVLDRLSNQIFEIEPCRDDVNKWTFIGDENISVKGSDYLPKELSKIVGYIVCLIGKNKFSGEIKEY